MKVILTENIKGLGRIGDVKNVSDGHARNFLFPKKLARVASEGALKEAEALQQKREAVNLKDKENAQKAIAILAEAMIEFKKKASKAGTLFSSVSKIEVAKQISKITGLDVDADMIDLGDLGEHIKQIGEHTITVDLDKDVKAPVRVSIKSE